jgi:hypothetical protein
MWIIENCFRKMKTTGLEVRPMFHWMPQRITAHVKLCVLALSRSAVRSLASSARQPDLRILWKTSIFQRSACQESIRATSSDEQTGRLVISFQLNRAGFAGGSKP